MLFLDEPTTGLDANSANAIIRLLHRYELCMLLLGHARLNLQPSHIYLDLALQTMHAYVYHR